MCSVLVQVSSAFFPLSELGIQSSTSDRVYKKEAAKHGGIAPPESRLLMGMAGAIGMFGYGVLSYLHTDG